MRRWLVTTLMLSILMPMLLAGWMLGTQSGLRAVTALAQVGVSGLQIEHADGRLVDKVELRGMVYRDGDVDVEIDRLFLRWRPGSLFAALVDIRQLHADGIRIALPASQDSDAAPPSLPELHLPLRIHLADVAVCDVSLIRPDGSSQQLVGELHSAFRLDFHRLRVDTLQISSDIGELTLDGEAGLISPHEVDVSYRVAMDDLAGEAIRAQGRLHGDSARLELTQTLASPVISSQQLVVKQPLTELQWRLQAQLPELQLEPYLSGQRVSVRQALLEAHGDRHTLEAVLGARIRYDTLPEMALQIGLHSADLSRFDLDAELAHAQQSLHAQGSVDLSGTAPHAELDVSWRDVQWPLQHEPEIHSPSGKLRVQGTADDYRLSLDTQVIWQQQHLAGQADMRGTLSMLSLEQLQFSLFDGELQARGHVDWQDEVPKFAIDTRWQDISLPPVLTELAIALDSGHITVDGDSASLVVAMTAAVRLDDRPITISAQADGHVLSGFDTTELEITLPGAAAGFKGSVSWEAQPAVDGVITLTGIDPAILAAQWPGRVSGGMRLHARQQDRGPAVSLSDIVLEGTLRELPVRARGALAYEVGALAVERFELRSGDSVLTASGEAGAETLGFDWRLSSRDLGEFYPGLGGRIEAQGRVSDRLDAPAIRAHIEAAQLSYQDLALGSLLADIDMVLAQAGKLQATAAVEALSLPDLMVDRLQLGVDGTQQAHRLELALNADLLDVLLQASGGLSGGQWRGQLARLDLANAQAGQWSLSQKGEIMLAADQQRLDRHCWAGAEGAFCLEAGHDARGMQASGQIDALPLSLLHAFSPQMPQLQGLLRGSFYLAMTPDQQVTGSGELHLDEGALRLEQPFITQQDPVRLDNTYVRYRLTDSDSMVKLHSAPLIDGLAPIELQISSSDVRRLLTSPELQPLSGYLRTTISDLSLLPVSHPDIDQLQGRFSLDLQLGGSMASPAPSGQATLEQGQVAIIPAGITLREIDARLSGDPDALILQLAMRSGQGTLNGSGRLLLPADGWRLEAEIQGEDVELVNQPEALVIASPDLTVLLDAKRAAITGRLVIPRAELEPTRFNTSVSPSAEVVVVDDMTPQEQSGLAADVDILVSLGEQVQIRAMGFRARLNGDLGISGTSDDLLRGNGEIRITDGSYRAYGQQLRVDDGRVRFAGGAIDNPELDVRAVRKGPNYVAGLHIEGPAQAPRVTLFSEPDMNQDDILSHILLGKPLQQAGAADAARLAAAAAGMGLQNGPMLSEQIASTFGLDEFAITGDSAETAGVQVGKYLSPRLYLGYGTSMIDAASTVELRYRLSRIWTLKAESGVESGVDLLYTHER